VVLGRKKEGGHVEGKGREAFVATPLLRGGRSAIGRERESAKEKRRQGGKGKTQRREGGKRGGMAGQLFGSPVAVPGTG